MKISNNTNCSNELSIQRALKGLAAQVHSSGLNLSTYIHVGKTLTEGNGYLPCQNQ